MKCAQEFGTAQHSDSGAKGQVDPVRYRLSAVHLLHGNEGETDERTYEVGDEEAEENVANAEPAKPHSEHRCQTNVAKSKGTRAYEIEYEEDNEPT